jgi:UDP-N-acetylglucosamine:LPS N-acetylglucosamine transferase
MTVIDLVYFNAGGGHRAAALALRDVIQAQKRPWQVRLVNLMEALDPAGRFTRITGFAPEDLYNMRLARGWTVGLSQELKLLQGMIRLGHASMVRVLQQHWLQTEPDLVVSLVPNFNRVLYESVTTTLPGVPYVTVMTDMADYPPHFWIEPGQNQHIVCGSARAVEQAREAGYADRQISLTSGMILRPAFYEPVAVDRDAALRALGLDPRRPTGLVMFGGQGSAQMLRIAKELADQQLILMCGHNASLAARLKAQSVRSTHAVLGFTADVMRYMHLADYFIGKPGPGCLSEAVQMGLPVITFRNASTMPQERYNTEWIGDNGVGLVLKSLRELPAAVAGLHERLPEMQACARRLDNRALFELPEILAAQLYAAALPAATRLSSSAATVTT